MGLDMYLYKKTYIWSGDYINEEVRQEVIVNKGGQRDPNIKSDRIRYVVEEVGYWRKANAIHNWFVENVQEAKDDCRTYTVARDQLLDLLYACNKVVSSEDNAPNELPTLSGFFYGGTEYDEYYLKTVKDTITILEDCLTDESADYFEYRASW
jgi:hypothetical protein